MFTFTDDKLDTINLNRLTLHRGTNIWSHLAAAARATSRREPWSNANGTLMGAPMNNERGLDYTGRHGQLFNAFPRTHVKHEGYSSSLRRSDYVIYSYETPIAWHDMRMNLWVMPEHTYSRTTTRHQHTVRTWVLQHQTIIS